MYQSILVVALCAVSLYRFTRSQPSKHSPEVPELPTDGE